MTENFESLTFDDLEDAGEIDDLEFSSTENQEEEKTGYEIPDSQGTMLEDVMSGLIKSNVEAPGTFAPRLISNQQGSTMGDAIRQELAESESFDMSVAFASENALKGMFQSFLDKKVAKGGQSRIITSTKNYFNDPKTFKELMKLQEFAGVQVRVWNQGSETDQVADQPFHPKGYLFSRRMKRGQPYFNLYVGSSNLTCSALGNQREWNLRVSSTDDADLIKEVQAELDIQEKESIPLTDEWIRQYEEDFQQYARPRKELLQEVKGKRIEPNAMQREALANLAQLREEGERKAIVISATGTGKTYLSALDVRACNPSRMLYVANRRQILTAAMDSYENVLECGRDQIGLVTGEGKKQTDRKYVFASVDTLRRNLELFRPDDFDYVLIDEVHHAGAEGYKKIIEYFNEASFMLGMTATPERTDGIDIFALFDHNVAYEIRLQQALDANMLCPFHYYGVSEFLTEDNELGVVNDGLSSKNKAALEEEIRRLTTKDRVRYIIDKLQQYGSYKQQVTGLVFCSRREEAHRLSELFNQEINQQEERLYRTLAVDGQTPQKERDTAIERLEAGELDYLFTVDLFNEGIDIPAINQIVMLRNTESSIVFTQQLGRGLRKFPDKSCVTVIDFIGNYANNYLIPVALYGNAGDRDINRKNMQKQQIGLSSVSFDEISRERVLKSLDTANWTEMVRLRQQYTQLRHELGRIPMLQDIYRHDPSWVMTMATKRANYLEFVVAEEKRYGKGKLKDLPSYLETLQPLDDTENNMLKMASELLLPGLRVQELVILDELCGFTSRQPQTTHTVGGLRNAIQQRYPDAFNNNEQLESALRVLSFAYFDSSERKRFGGTPLIATSGDPDTIQDYDEVSLTPEFRQMLESNQTFRYFFGDCVRTGFLDFKDLMEKSVQTGRDLYSNHGFVYEHKYKLDEVARLLAWRNRVNGQNIGGYKLDSPTNTMPIFVKYAASQYEDRFINPQEIHWYSKNKRNPGSPEFRWLAGNADSWQDHHFVPLFVMRREEADEAKYYYVGHVVSYTTPQLLTRPDGSGNEVNVTTTDLHLAKPIDAELYRHLTGIAEF